MGSLILICTFNNNNNQFYFEGVAYLVRKSSLRPSNANNTQAFERLCLDYVAVVTTTGALFQFTGSDQLHTKIQ